MNVNIVANARCFRRPVVVSDLYVKCFQGVSGRKSSANLYSCIHKHIQLPLQHQCVRNLKTPWRNVVAV